VCPKNRFFVKFFFGLCRFTVAEFCLVAVFKRQNTGSFSNAIHCCSCERIEIEVAEDSGEVLSPSTLVGLASAGRRLVAGKVYVDERGHDDNNVISNQLLISISIVNTAHVYASNCTWQMSEFSQFLLA